MTRSLLLLTLLFSTPSLPAVHADDAPKLGIPEKDDGLPGAGPIRRYDWFRNLWLKRRTTWAERVEQDQNAVVFLGDSITQGWGDDFKKSFGDMKVANRGISGDTTRGMLVRLTQDVLDLNPKAVVILAGTNDLEEKATPEQIVGNLELIVAALEKHDPEMPIVLCKVMPSSASKRRPAEAIKKINDLLAKAVKGKKNVVVLETWVLFADEKGDAKKAEFPDLLHPNAAGYAKWAAGLRPVFATLGYLETEPDDWKPEPGFELLFNGEDLTGWGYRKTPDATRQRLEKRAKNPNAIAWPIWDEDVAFDGKKESVDGRYVAKHGRLIVTTPAEGRRIQQIWTTREFPGDFVLKLEFRATPYADSGIFVRQPQLQCRDYPLAGPYTDLEKYRPQDWNEVVVTVKGNVAHCTCNGEVLEAEFKVPDTGPIGLEGDRGQMEYRRIRVKTLD